MTYDARSRDRYRWAVTGISGAVAAGVLIGTGAISGQAARDLKDETAADQARKADEYAAWQAEQARYERDLKKAERAAAPVLKQRPTATRFTTRYVTGGTQSGSVSVRSSQGSASGGGTAPSGKSRGTKSGGGGGTPAPPPPPPPPPPPASSGS